MVSRMKEKQKFVKRDPIFDIDQVIELYKNIRSPQNQEELVGMLLPGVKQAGEKLGATNCYLVELLKTDTGFKFILQGKINGKDEEFAVIMNQRPQNMLSQKVIKGLPMNDSSVVWDGYLWTLAKWKKYTSGRENDGLFI